MRLQDTALEDAARFLGDFRAGTDTMLRLVRSVGA